MKFSHVLPLAAVTTAFVMPDAQVFGQISIQDRPDKSGIVQEVKGYLEDVAQKSTDAFERLTAGSHEVVEDVTETSTDAWERISKSSKDVFADVREWFGDAQESAKKTPGDVQDWLAEGEMNIFGDHHGGHGKHGHHGEHGHGPNRTVYQLISESKYTTKLAKLINKFDDLVETLNSTKANYTIFAPIDEAFEHIPDHVKISDEKLKKILTYHVIPDFYPAKRVLTSYTAPTLLKVDHLSDQPEPQRLAFKLGLKGLAVNFYSRVVAINIFGTNGVIHGVRSIIVPPPNAVTIIDLLPGDFSTLELGLIKTGLIDKLNTTDHNGGTIFAPSNFAFQKLGPRINGFLFSKYGEKYLKALLEYHVVTGHTLYTDALYKAGEKKETIDATGKFHIDLPTLLKDRSLSVDIATWAGFTSIHINTFSRVTVGDGVASDGVIHGVSDVLIPPKQLGSGMEQKWEGEELTVDDLKERLEAVKAKGDL